MQEMAVVVNEKCGKSETSNIRNVKCENRGMSEKRGVRNEKPEK